MRPWALLSLLEQYDNLGCHIEFGRAGKIAYCTRLLNTEQESFRLRLEMDLLAEEEEPEVVSFVVSAEQLAQKNLPSEMVFRLVGSRIFLRAGKDGSPGELLLLHEPGEVVRLLRTNLEHLKKRNDAASRSLYHKLTRIESESAWADEALCLELNRMSDESTEHIRRILRQAPDRRKAVEALDRGEGLRFFEDKPEGAQTVDELSQHDVGFLVSVVRARYVLEMLRRRTANKDAKLTPLGQKLFGGRPAEEFSDSELRQVLDLARRAFERPLSPTSDLGQASESLVR